MIDYIDYYMDILLYTNFILSHLHIIYSVTLGRPGEIPNMFRNKNCKKKQNKKLIMKDEYFNTQA